MTAPTTPGARTPDEDLRRAILGVIPENLPLRGRISRAIVAGPLADLRQQLAAANAERDEADRDRTDMMWQRRRAEERAEDAKARLQALEAENARMRTALTFYADEQNYRLGGLLDPNSSRFTGNETARAALPPIEEKPNE